MNIFGIDLSAFKGIITKAIGTAIRHGLNGVGVWILATGWIPASLWESLATNIEGVAAIAVAAVMSWIFKVKAEKKVPELK